MHCQQIPFVDADVAHAGAAYLQKIVGVRVEQTGFDLYPVLDMRLTQDRAARSNPSDHRQAGAFGQPNAT